MVTIELTAETLNQTRYFLQELVTHCNDCKVLTLQEENTLLNLLKVFALKQKELGAKEELVI